MRSRSTLALVPCLLVAGQTLSLRAQAAAEAPKAAGAATVEVTATRFPEDPVKVPASITVLTAKDLADRGATDLRSALALAAGINIAPGGDSGPAASIPEFWGLKEFDAFLLVVDGVPWGGAFNPALSTLDLENVERIEIQRGAAPVMYGATSFVGVIQVIHKLPADTEGSVRLSGGSHGSGGAAVTLRLPRWSKVDSSLTADVAKQGYDDPRTEFKRGHVLWRNRAELGGGVLRFDLDAAAVDQKPASPHPRVGKVLTTDVPLDANHNPDGAYINDRRATFTLGWDQPAGSALWSTILSTSRSRQDLFRGFLVDVVTTDPNAHGYRERIETTDVYFDTHLAWTDLPGLKVVAGFDHLHGAGTGRGGDFDYVVNLDGSNAPGSAALPPAADIRIDDRRDFSGLYAFAEWSPVARLVVEGGLRLNRTEETRRAFTLDFASATLDGGQDQRTVTRLSGSAGITWTAWQAGADRVNLFASYRNTYKPAAIDFGLDSTPGILKPETAESYDLGAKSRLLDGRLDLELSTFLMDFSNLVVSQTLGGLPVMVNAGQQRFQGVELSADARLKPDWTLHGAYSYHDSRFRDYVQDFGGTATQLAGKRLEMSPYHLGALGLVYAPARGFTGLVEVRYTGGIFMDKRNRAPYGGYTTLAAGLGYRAARWEFRVKGDNLSDRRDPVAESEMGDAQYYLLPGRRATASVSYRF
ncbi:MAG TPA: TonB-dependent receptor [Holophagaceae bacterium]